MGVAAQHPADAGQRRLVVADGCHAIVAGEGHGVVFQRGQGGGHAVGKAGMGIGVQVAQMQQAEPGEGRRQAWPAHVVVDHLNIQHVGHAASVKAGALQKEPENLEGPVQVFDVETGAAGTERPGHVMHLEHQAFFHVLPA